MTFKKKLRILKGSLCSVGKPKVFCVGFNKTGTTSVKRAFKDLGFAIGDQRTAELFLEAWTDQSYEPIINYCRSAQVFQDFPFSFPGTYRVLDQAYPGSRFILTVRDSSEQWYTSITRFHSKLWADGIRLPTKEDLQQATYIYKGRPWDSNRALFASPESDPYNKESLISCYERHNQEVIDYFKDRPDDLLVLNVADEGAYAELCGFMGLKTLENSFPWANKTDAIERPNGTKAE